MIKVNRQHAALTGRGFLLSFLAGWLGLLMSGEVRAQTLTTLHDFSMGDGVTPASVILSGNTLYATGGGGISNNGTLFKVKSDGTGLTVLHTFTAFSGPLYTNSDGAVPYGTLIISGNTLYGTASQGGASGFGTVFRLNTDGTGFTNLHDFTADYNYPDITNTDGVSPKGGLILSGNTLYGTTSGGGSFGGGTVFAVNTDGTGFTNLHSFTEASASPYINGDGAYPQCALVLVGSTLYGAAVSGGALGSGTLFAMNMDSTGFTNLHSFRGFDGSEPISLSTSDGILYGTTYVGGSFGNGTVFTINTDGTGFASLYSFSSLDPNYSTNSDGISTSGVVASGNVLYGAALSGGGHGRGAIFKVTTDGAGFTNLHNFSAGSGSYPNLTNSDGVYPYGVLVSGNTLYGTTSTGGSHGSGTIFSLDLPPPSSFTTLHNFNGGDGAKPYAGLLLSGNTLYGAADAGGLGVSGFGVVFALDTHGSGFRKLYSFSGNDGSTPDGALVISSNTLFGTTLHGGNVNNGSIFAVNTAGTGFTTLHKFTVGSGTLPQPYFNNDGINPEVGVILSGNTLYGTTEGGGSGGQGVVFAIGTDGNGFTVLHNFTNDINGAVPEALLLSGNTLYGVAVGLYKGNGAVFKINTDGTGFTNLHSFITTNFVPANGGPPSAPRYANADGVAPTGLAIANDTLYGTAYFGGSWGNGAVFRMNTDGTEFTNLHSFSASYTNFDGIYTNTEGAHPISGVILSDGTLYGTTYYGGVSGNGTIFAINTDGTGFTNLYAFSAAVSGINGDGINPDGKLIISGNTLYGTAKFGGAWGDGTVFSVSLSASQPLLTVNSVGNNLILNWPTSAAGFALQSTTRLDSPAWTTNSLTPSIVNGQNVVTLQISGNQQFFRLAK